MTPAQAPSGDPGRAARAADALATRVLGLPPARTGYRRVAERVPMRDGVQLLADHLVPDTAHPLGTVLVRTPYGRGGPLDLLSHRTLAARGYHVLVQSVRGTFGSGGEFEPMAREADDGHDTVAWLRTQGWFDARLATMGASYLGWTQWALMTDPPPELKASVVVVGPHHFGEAVYGTGAFTLADFLGWSNMVVHQEETGPGAVQEQVLGRRRLRAAFAGLPLDVAGERLMQGRAPWYRDWVGHPRLDDPYWEPRDHSAALEQTQAPILLVGGWQDIFLPQTVAQYAHLRDRGQEVALTIGPWTHLGTVLRGSGRVMRETLAWFDRHLAGVTGAPRATVHIAVTGAGKGWRDYDSWPPPTAPHERHLQPGGLLGVTAPGPETDPVALFRYEPADPTPTVGGRLLDSPAGVQNQRRLEARGDVSLFTSEPLHRDLEVQGVVQLELRHSTDNPHADLFVRLSDVSGGTPGGSRNVTEAHLRLDPDRDPAVPIRLALDPCAHRFAAGHRLRLLVAGGSHPRFARNPGTGAGPLQETRLEGSTHTLHSGHLTLPVVLEQTQADGSR